MDSGSCVSRQGFQTGHRQCLLVNHLLPDPRVLLCGSKITPLGTTQYSREVRLRILNLRSLRFESSMGYMQRPFLRKKKRGGLSIQSQQHKPSDCVSDGFGRACESVEVPSTHRKQTQLVTNFQAQMEKRLQGNKPNF